MMWLRSLPLIASSLGLVAFPTSALGLAKDGYLLIGDTGAPVKSTPTWDTSLRRIDTDGSSSSVLQTFPFRLSVIYRAGINALVRDPRNDQLYLATLEELFRTELDGTKREQMKEGHGPTFQSLAISDGKLYAGDCKSSIWRLDLNGGAFEIFKDVRSEQGNDNTTCIYGLAIDKINGKIYWSDINEPVDDGRPHVYPGFIRRASLTPNAADVETLAGVFAPKTIRLSSSGYLYWAEAYNRYNHPTALRRARIPPSNSAFEIETVFDSTQDALLTIGENLTAPIISFALDEKNDRLWFAGSDHEFPMLLEAALDGANARIINQNMTEIGYPRGLEYISGD